MQTSAKEARFHLSSAANFLQKYKNVGNRCLTAYICLTLHELIYAGAAAKANPWKVKDNY